MKAVDEAKPVVRYEVSLDILRATEGKYDTLETVSCFSLICTTVSRFSIHVVS